MAKNKIKKLLENILKDYGLEDNFRIEDVFQVTITDHQDCKDTAPKKTKILFRQSPEGEIQIASSPKEWRQANVFNFWDIINNK